MLGTSAADNSPREIKRSITGNAKNVLSAFLHVQSRDVDLEKVRESLSRERMAHKNPRALGGCHCTRFNVGKILTIAEANVARVSGYCRCPDDIRGENAAEARCIGVMKKRGDS
jgi:hypothetical protein